MVQRVIMWWRSGAIMVAGGLLAGAVIGPAVAAADFSPPLLKPSDPVTVYDTDNGHTIQLARGTEFQVVLRSTYWRSNGTSNAAVLAVAAPPQTQSNRGDCPPGVGCGAVTQSFIAVGAGQAEVSADRTVCGEALACRPDQRHFAVTVMVSD